MAMLKDSLITGDLRVTGNIYGTLQGNATTATTLQTARTINGTSFNGSANITTANWGTARTVSIASAAGTTGTSVNGSGNVSLIVPSTMTGFSSITSTTFVGALTGHASLDLALTGGTMSGDLIFSSPGATAVRQIRLQCADNDYGRIAVGGTASNSGYMEIATADDATEPIYVRQYSGVYTTLNTTLTLLDASHNTTIPGRLTMNGGQAINQLLTGSGTAATSTTADSVTTYYPAKWTFNTGRAPVNGDIYTIKIPVAGHDYGVFMSVNNGTNYYPVINQSTNRVTTHYPKDYMITVVFDSSGSAASIFPVAGGTARTTASGGAFRVTNYYDSNTDVRPASYCTTAAGTAAKVASHSAYVLKANSYTLVTIQNANTSASALTLNINSTGAKPIYINGSASSASNYTLPAGTYVVFYNGTNYYFRTDAGIQGGTWFGNASTATTLQTSRTINGTNFNGSANITTANWGTARNIYIADSDGTNTGTAVSVNGSANATLKLPATIKATLTGHASLDLALTGGTVTGVTTFSNTTASTSTTTGAVKISGGLGVAGNIYGAKVYNAVWNDYAEYRTYNDGETPYGRIVCENGDDSVSLSTKRLQPGAMICSDTFGTCMGDESDGIPIAVAGRVLAYTMEPREEYLNHIGEAVCAGPDGMVSIMTKEEVKEYPECVIGYVSAVPNYEEWGTGNIKVDGRVWIKVK